MSEPHTNRVRASDAEREEVAARLRSAMGEGRLSLDEGEQRLAAAYATTYRDELPEFTADLPPVEPPPRGPSPGQPWAGRTRRSRAGSPWPAVPVVGLVLVAAVVAGVWAAAASGPLWPAILLGVFALMLAKRGRRRYWHGARPGHPCHRRQEAEPGERGYAARS